MLELARGFVDRVDPAAGLGALRRDFAVREHLDELYTSGDRFVEVLDALAGASWTRLSLASKMT